MIKDVFTTYSIDRIFLTNNWPAPKEYSFKILPKKESIFTTSYPVIILHTEKVSQPNFHFTNYTENPSPLELLNFLALTNPDYVVLYPSTDFIVSFDFMPQLMSLKASLDFCWPLLSKLITSKK